MATTLSLPDDVLRSTVRRLDSGRLVDPVALLLAIWDAESTTALDAARVAAIGRLAAVGGPIFPAERRSGDGLAPRCPVRDGRDALALGCPVDLDVPLDPDGGMRVRAGRTEDRPVIHQPHDPMQFHARIAYVTARVRSRLERRALQWAAQKTR